MCTYLKNMEGYKLNDLKLKEFDSIQEMFDRAFKRVNTFKDFRTELVEGKEKRAGVELVQESIKKQKVEDDKETAELKQRMEIIPDEEVAIDVIPLASKSPSIVGWKIHKEGRKSYYQIMRADGKSQILLDVVWITAAHVCVNAAQLELGLLRDFKENMLTEVNAASENMLEVTTASEYQVNAANTPSPQPSNPFLDDIMDAPPRPSNPPLFQSHTLLDITLSLSPITPLDHILDTPSPPSPQPPPQPPLMGHPIYFNMFDYNRVNCLCCFHNQNLIFSLRDEMNLMFANLKYLLTSAIASPSPPHP
ncbi:hypothetical protein Tco_1250775 [Tanacetum coccineum]